MKSIYAQLEQCYFECVNRSFLSVCVLFCFLRSLLPTVGTLYSGCYMLHETLPNTNKHITELLTYIAWSKLDLLSWKGTQSLMILLCWYGAKDRYFILLTCHFLYSRPGGSQNRLYRGQIQKLLYCCQKSYQQFPLVIPIHKKYSLTYLRRTVLKLLNKRSKVKILILHGTNM